MFTYCPIVYLSLEFSCYSLSVLVWQSPQQRLKLSLWILLLLVTRILYILCLKGWCSVVICSYQHSNISRQNLVPYIILSSVQHTTSTTEVLFHFRHIYDLQQRPYPSKTIMIGSTHIIKPNTFLQEIQNGVNVLNPCTDYADITVE